MQGASAADAVTPALANSRRLARKAQKTAASNLTSEATRSRSGLFSPRCQHQVDAPRAVRGHAALVDYRPVARQRHRHVAGVEGRQVGRQRGRDLAAQGHQPAYPAVPGSCLSEWRLGPRRDESAGPGRQRESLRCPKDKSRLSGGRYYKLIRSLCRSSQHRPQTLHLNRQRYQASSPGQSHQSKAALAAVSRQVQNTVAQYPRSVGGRRSSAATRGKPVSPGTASCAQGASHGLVGAPQRSSVFARFASTPSAARAPSAWRRTAASSPAPERR